MEQLRALIARVASTTEVRVLNHRRIGDRKELVPPPSIVRGGGQRRALRVP